MTGIPGIVTEPCDPYPIAPDYTAFERHPDGRHSRWLSTVLDQLDRDELENLGRALAQLLPRAFEQELLEIQKRRDWRAGGRSHTNTATGQ